MNPPMLVSIIINNFNYGRFLAFAIESALAQSYPMTEVLVVDDGSTDNSRAVIAAYGDRIVPVLKENGGQASALNAGFARSHGSVVIFLDADDTLHPQVVEQVVARFQAGAEVVRVQYQLETIDNNGKLLGLAKPERPSAIPQGDLRQQVLLYGDDLPWLPTSGNAFSANMLHKIFPIPEAPYKICADYYLSNLSPLYGVVEALEASGGCYRVHTSNHHEKDHLDLEQMRQLIVRTHQTHHYIYEHAHRLGLLTRLRIHHGVYSPDDVSALAVSFPANRLISLRLAPAQHPLAADRRMSLARRGIWAAWRHRSMSLLLKFSYISWFCLTCVAPKRALPWLAESLFYPRSKDSWFNQFLSLLGRAKAVQNLPVKAKP